LPQVLPSLRRRPPRAAPRRLEFVAVAEQLLCD